MADYSVQLGEVQDQARTIADPGDSSVGNALASLARGIDTVSDAFRARASNRRAAYEMKRQQAEDAQKAGTRSAQNAAAISYAAIERGDFSAFPDLKAQQDAALGQGNAVKVGGSLDASVNMTENDGEWLDMHFGVGEWAKKIKTYDTAVRQGKLPGITKDAMVERAFQTLLSQHPGHEYDLAKAFDEIHSVKSPIFSQIIADTEKAAADRKQTQSDFDRFVSKGREIYGADAGLFPPEELAAAGATWFQNDLAMKDRLQQAQLNSQIQSTKQGEYNLNRELNRDATEQGTIEQFTTAVSPWANMMKDLIQQAGEPGHNPAVDEKLKDTQLRFQAWLAGLKSNLIARAGAQSPEAIERLNSFMDNYYKDNFQSIMEQRDKGMAQALSSVQSYLGLQSATAAPVITGLRSMGINVSNIPAFLDAIGQDQGLIKQLSQEFQGYVKLKPGTPLATLQLNMIADSLTGKVHLEDVPSRDAPKVVGASIEVIKNMAPKVAAGKVEDPEMYMHALGNAITAVRSINQTSGMDSLRKATISITGNGAANIGAINKLLADPVHREDALPLAQGSRAAAALLLNSYRRAVGAEQDKSYNIVYNADKVAYEIVPVDRDARNALSERPTNFRPGVPHSAEPTRVVPSGELRNMADSMNGLLQYLVRTGDWDQGAAPKGTPKEVAAYWAENKPTPDMLKSVEKGKQKISGDTEFFKSAAKFEKMLLDNPTDLVPADAIVKAEGSGDNPRSSASGPGQFLDSTFKSMMSKYHPDVEINSENIDSLKKKFGREMTNHYARENGQRLAEAGFQPTMTNVYLAHFAGPQGAIKLLKADPHTPVEKVLGDAAINANPHLRGLSVGDAIRWAERFIHRGKNG